MPPQTAADRSALLELLGREPGLHQHRAVGQASSLYSFWYYVGSSVGGTLAGRAWSDAGWSGVVVLAGGSTLAALLLSLVLGRTRSLERR